MVNTTIVSRYTSDLPLGAGKGRKISGGPLYSADEVLALLVAWGDQAVSAWTTKCIEDMQKWTLDADDLCGLIKIAVCTGRFLGAEWCVQKPNGPWAACDAYRLSRREWVANARKEMDFEHYVKFAVNKNGNPVVGCFLPSPGR